MNDERRAEILEAMKGVVGDDVPDGGEVQQLWIAVAIDKEGNEGIPAMMNEHGIVAPILTSESSHLPKMRELMSQLIKGSGKRMVIRQFTQFFDIEEFIDEETSS